MAFSLQKILMSACACGCCGVAAAQEPAVQLFVFAGGEPEQPRVLMWEQMSAQQGARLWPLLSHEQRLVKWRHMSREERNMLRRSMTPGERRDRKSRFVINPDPGELDKKLKARKMTPAERDLLRRQVMQVHVEIKSGIPYDCEDPTDCRRHRILTPRDEDREKVLTRPHSAAQTPSVVVPDSQAAAN